MGAKVRLIPVLLLKSGLLVRSQGFDTHQIIGNPINEVSRYNEWNVDELVYLDITRGRTYTARRDDHRHASLDDPLDILEEVARTCFMPLTWGGRIRTVDDMRDRFVRGADKITINSEAVRNPTLITAGAERFGSQAIVVSIDVTRLADGTREVLIDGGTTRTNRDPADWARQAQDCGAGEIFLQSTDEDGRGQGYDVDTIRCVADAVDIPVVACSGVGQFEHFAAGVEAGASAVAAANLWHFKELADRQGKRALAAAGVEVRMPSRAQVTGRRRRRLART